jgi:hypothetical protein
MNFKSTDWSERYFFVLEYHLIFDEETFISHFCCQNKDVLAAISEEAASY